MSGLETGRAIGLGMSPRVRLKLVSTIRALWAEDPSVTINAMVQRTKAPGKMVQRIRSSMVNAGQLPGRGS